jgi:hypothetical protein
VSSATGIDDVSLQSHFESSDILAIWIAPWASCPLHFWLFANGGYRGVSLAAVSLCRFLMPTVPFLGLFPAALFGELDKQETNV